MRILLVDDHSLIRAGLRDSLNKYYESTDIFEAESSKTALALTQAEHFDLALIDLFIPGEKLFKLVGECCAHNPELPVIVLSSSDNTGHIRKCIDLGAVGFVSKSMPQSSLFEAIDIVLAGGTFFPPPNAGSQLTGNTDMPSSGPLSMEYAEVKGILTKRQMEILIMMAQGKPNKQIARELELSGETVKVHVSAIFKALGLTNRSQAAILGQKLGLSLQDPEC